MMLWNSHHKHKEICTVHPLGAHDSASIYLHHVHPNYLFLHWDCTGTALGPAHVNTGSDCALHLRESAASKLLLCR